MHRVLFVIPVGQGIPVFGYGLFMMLGFVVGLAIACHRARKAGLPKNGAMDVGLISIFTGVVGARLAYLLVDYHPLEGDGFVEWFAVWNGGLTFQGGLILAVVCVLVYLRRAGIPVGRMLDAYAPALAVGAGFGRLGCLMNGCCWGKAAPAWFPFGMSFPRDIEPMALQLDDFANWPDDWAGWIASLGYPPGTEPPIPLYPTQLASALGLFLVGFALVVAGRLWKKRSAGQVVLWFVFAYSIGRFLVEFWRDDTPLRYGFAAFPGLKLGQWLALATFAAGVVLQIVVNRRAGKGKP